jgi:hypothetical protein
LNTIEALKLAQIAEKYIPDDSTLIKLTGQFTCRLTILSNPPGADVYIKEYNDFGEDWQLLGTTPIESIRMPLAFFRWKFEKPGYDSVLAAMPSPRSDLDTIYRNMDFSLINMKSPTNNLKNSWMMADTRILITGKML